MQQVFGVISWYLSDVVLVQASLQPDPRLGLQVGDLFDDLQHVRHLFDGDHLLVPQAHPQVADAFDGRLDVRLLVRLHVDVTFDVIRGDHGLDLQRLLGGGGWSSYNSQAEQNICPAADEEVLSTNKLLTVSVNW